MSIASPTFLTTALLACALAACAGSAPAQEIVPPGPDGRGAIQIRGNFGGPGSRGPGYLPIDALDLACAHHDACLPEPISAMLPTCACSGLLRVEAGLVAQDPQAPARTRQTARFISDFAAALPCR